MMRNSWITGFTPQAELWNGRLAMIGFVSAIAIELLTHHGVLRFWGILSSGVVPGS
nr:chlorophyll a/b-binding protein [Pseudanabaena sp. BC1403]